MNKTEMEKRIKGLEGLVESQRETICELTRRNNELIYKENRYKYLFDITAPLGYDEYIQNEKIGLCLTDAEYNGITSFINNLKCIDGLEDLEVSIFKEVVDNG